MAEYTSNYMYNGEELPAYPDLAYPYAYISINRDESYASLMVFDKQGYLEPTVGTDGEILTNIYTLGLTTDDTYDESKIIYAKQYVVALNEAAVGNLESVWPGISTTAWMEQAWDQESLGIPNGSYYSLPAEKDGPIWSNIDILLKDGTVHLAGTDAIGIVVRREEFNAGVAKFWTYQFMDKNEVVIENPNATYTWSVTNDSTGEAVDTDTVTWMNWDSFPTVYVYSTSPENHTVLAIFTWTDADGLTYRGHQYYIIGEAVEEEAPEETPDETPEEDTTTSTFCLKSFLTGLTLGLAGKPVLIGGQRTPVAYLYNGVRLPPLPEWDKTVYPYAVICNQTTGYVLSVSGGGAAPTFESPNLHCYGSGFVYTAEDNAWSKPNAKDEAFSVPWVVGIANVIWANVDVLGTTSGSVVRSASTPVPVYE